MKFDSAFRLRLVKALQKRKWTFFDSMNSIINPSSIYITLVGYYGFYLQNSESDQDNFNNIKKDLSESIGLEDSPKLKNRLHFLFASNQPVFGSRKYLQFFEQAQDKAKEFEKIFWQDKEKNAQFQKLSENFLCFVDKKVDKKDIQRYQLHGHILNVEGWVSYYKRLLSFFFPDYSSSQGVSKGSISYLISINEEIDFGFEFNEKMFLTELARGRLYFPDMSLILKNEKYSISKNGFDSNFKNSDCLLIIDSNFKNPYFTTPAVSLEMFFSILKQHHPLFYDYVEDVEGINIKHKKFIGESLKSYAFFEFYLSSYFLHSYLKYLQESIKLSLSDNSSLDAESKSLVNDIKKRNDFLEKQILELEKTIAKYKDGKTKLMSGAIKKLELALGKLQGEYQKNLTLLSIKE